MTPLPNQHGCSPTRTLLVATMPLATLLLACSGSLAVTSHNDAQPTDIAPIEPDRGSLPEETDTQRSPPDSTVPHDANCDSGAMWPATNANCPDPPGRPKWAGVWTIWGNGYAFNDVDKPWHKGHLLGFKWNEIEPTNDHFSFAAMDSQITLAASNNLHIALIFYHGNKTPNWVYQEGVPRVEVVGSAQAFPYYLDPDYKPLLKDMIDKVAAHLESYAPHIRQRILFVQVAVGTSGDAHPYNPPVAKDAQYAISSNSPEWDAWSKDVWRLYRDAYAGSSIGLMLNENSQDLLRWAENNGFANPFLKMASLNQVYSGKNEMEHHYKWKSDRCNSRVAPTRCRGEFTYQTQQVYQYSNPSWFDDAPAWNAYWQALWATTIGFDMFNTWSWVVEDYGSAFADAFQFIDAHMGYKDPQTAKQAWIAFRDDLDVSDSQRFPVGTYGAVDSGRNRARYEKILEEYSTHGAIQGDWNAKVMQMPYMGPLKYAGTVKSLNDVNYNVFRGNYGRYMKQFDPNRTSQSYFRKGPLDQPYGRYARGLRDAKMNTIYLDIDNAFFSGSPLDGKYSVRVKVTYFDQGYGTWQLKYDALSASEKPAYTQKKGNSGRWKQKTVTISDGYFGDRGPNGADLMLVNNDDEDDIFHMVELIRGN